MAFHSHNLGQGSLARELYSPREIEHMLSISHAYLYRLLADGKLTAVKIGRGTFIQRSALEKFLAELPPANLGPKKAA